MNTQPRPIAVSILLLLSVVAVSAGPFAYQLRDVDGTMRDPFRPAGAANVLFFVSSDCPISNGYAPEIQRICGDYRKKGVACSLIYEDVSLEIAGVRAHREAYRYPDISAVIDRDRAIAERAKATVTPQAVVVGAAGTVKYRGRIDNQYAALGKPRRVVTVLDLRDALDAILAGRAVAHPETDAVGCFITPRAVAKEMK